MDNHSIFTKYEFESSRVPEIGRDVEGSPGVSTAFAQEVNKIMSELAELLISKHSDYGPKNISASPGGPINGLRVRMHDKLARINNLVDNNRDAKFESLEDSFKDLANYAVIGLMVLRDKWDK